MQPVSKSPQFGAVMKVNSPALASVLVNNYKQQGHPVIQLDLQYAGEVPDRVLGYIAKTVSSSFVVTGEDACDLSPLLKEYKNSSNTLDTNDAVIVKQLIKEKLCPESDMRMFRITALNVIQHVVSLL